MSLPGPTFILTGGSRGLGLACLKILLDAPFAANVVSVSRSSTPELEALAQKYPGNLIISKGDISDEKCSQAVVEVTLQSFGAINGLILNSGIADFGKVVDMDMDVYRRTFDVNFFSLVSMLKLTIPHLRKSSGRVVFVSSGAATGSTHGWSAYNTSKAAMNSLCRTVAMEEEDICFVALRPGVVDTAMQEDIRSRGGPHMSQKDHAKFTDLHANGKLVPADKPGHVMAALALTAEKKLSGGFFSWDSEEMEPYRKK